MRPLPLFLAVLSGVAVSGGSGAPPAAAPDFTPSHSGQFVFTLAPKLAQRNPAVDVTVITEMTEAGRKRRAPTAADPAYYVAKTIGYHDTGQGLHGETPLPPALLQARLEQALRAAHFLAVATDRPVPVAMIFVWGASNALDPTADPSTVLPEDTGTPDIGHRALLARAALIAGDKFANAMARALQQQDELQNANVGGPSPLEIFESQSFENRRLVEQAQADCFYVVASAYDAPSLAQGRKVLLWRTKITTSAQGVAMADALPRLIVAGESYFGKDMATPALLTGHLEPQGHVEVGVPVVVPRAEGSP